MRRLAIDSPGLLDLPEPGRLSPLLARLIARARPAGAAGEVPLAVPLGLSSEAAAGPLSRLAVEPGSSLPREDRESAWVRFDAVTLVPDLTAVWLREPQRVDFPSAAGGGLAEELARMFEAHGLEWWRPEATPGFGLLRVPRDAPLPRFVPADAARGRRLDEILPTGDDAARWRSLINESQMVFHQVRGVLRGTDRGAGLWFWGAGVLPERTRSGAAVAVVSSEDDVVHRGLARWARATAPERAERVGVHWPVAGARDPAAALAELEHRWLAPAWSALRRFRLERLALADTGRCLELTPLDSWSAWRRSPGRAAVGS
ncbi:MAG: hypothetical protein R3323_03595 [Wenzhouxiangellaceae bacterium]|nr:hypothetical protein [Wenzhouxiangellaceae bacterium]